jgi:hypothetical protein
MKDGSGLTSHEPFGFFDPNTFYLRTSHRSLDLGGTVEVTDCGIGHPSRESLKTWPKQGTWDLGAVSGLPTPAHRTDANGSSFLPTPTVSGGGAEPEPDSEQVEPQLETSRRDDTQRLRSHEWWNATDNRAKYWPAVDQWEQLTGRVAPGVAVDGQLNPQFSEWMMGLPAGWVTDCDIPKGAKHRAIGNGVVPAQVRLALALLTGTEIDTHTHAGARLPTPTSRDGKGRNQRNDTSCLPGAILSLSLLPTPRTSDSNGAGPHGGGGPDLRTTVSKLQIESEDL